MYIPGVLSGVQEICTLLHIPKALAGDVLNVAEREVRPGLSLGESDGFATVVMLLDHLLDRELMETSESWWPGGTLWPFLVLVSLIK